MQCFQLAMGIGGAGKCKIFWQSVGDSLRRSRRGWNGRSGVEAFATPSLRQVGETPLSGSGGVAQAVPGRAHVAGRQGGRQRQEPGRRARGADRDLSLILNLMIDDELVRALLSELVEAHPSIREIWLLGSRAAGTQKADSDWDFFVFADRETFEALASQPRFNRPNVDLLVVYDDDNFRKPWPDGDRVKKGALSGWAWKATGDNATYRATKPLDGDDFRVDVLEGRAVRIDLRGLRSCN